MAESPGKNTSDNDPDAISHEHKSKNTACLGMVNGELILDKWQNWREYHPNSKVNKPYKPEAEEK
jgi:hypothetical protein